MKWQRVLGAVLTALGIIGTTLRYAFESAIIVALGIHTLSSLTVIAGLVTGFGLGNIVLSFVPAIKARLSEGKTKKLLKSKLTEEIKSISEYESDSLNPEKIRTRLLQLQSRNANLRDIMAICILQKDEIDRCQEQLNRLIRANDALYLNDVPAVLDSAEERICANFRDIINCCILVEYDNTPLSEHSKEIVTEALKSNKEELEAVRTLLGHSVAYINDYNRKGISDRRELDAWIKTMEEKINKKGELTLE